MCVQRNNFYLFIERFLATFITVISLFVYKTSRAYSTELNLNVFFQILIKQLNEKICEALKRIWNFITKLS